MAIQGFAFKHMEKFEKETHGWASDVQRQDVYGLLRYNSEEKRKCTA